MTSFISTDTNLSEPRFNRAWRNASGDLVATVELAPMTTLYFHSTADARAVAAACTEAAEALERLEAEGSQA